MILVVAPLERGPVIYFASSVWALVGGAILLGDAVRLRRIRQHRERIDRLEQEGSQQPREDTAESTGDC